MPVERQTSGSSRGARSTRDRLLDAGERLFAEHGFDATAVRDITAVARCNVAAVNYYFGGKENLYQEVFRRRLVEFRELRISRLEEAMQSAGSEATLEIVITAFISAFLEPLTASRAWRDLMRLFAREMLTPRLQSGMLMREMVEPVETAMARALCEVEPDLDEATARMCTVSLVAQLSHLVHARGYLGDREAGWVSGGGREAMVEHINRFTVGAIRSLVQGGTRWHRS